MEKLEEILRKIDDPTKTSGKFEELFYRGLGGAIFVVGAIPTLVFVIIEPGLNNMLRGVDSDVKVPPKK